MMVDMGFLYTAFIMLSYVPIYIPIFFYDFYHEGMLDFIKGLFCI